MLVSSVYTVEHVVFNDRVDTIVCQEIRPVYSDRVTNDPCLQAITIIGTPEACTEACYQIMKIMQNELLMTSGLLENG